MRLGRVAGLLDDLFRLGAGLLEALAVFGEDLVGLGAERSAESIDSSMLARRSSRAAVMRGKTAFLRMYSEIAKTTRIQIIRPTLGVINHEEELAAIGGFGMMARGCIVTYRKKAMKPPTRP